MGGGLARIKETTGKVKRDARAPRWYKPRHGSRMWGQERVGIRRSGETGGGGGLTDSDVLQFC